MLWWNCANTQASYKHSLLVYAISTKVACTGLFYFFFTSICYVKVPLINSLIRNFNFSFLLALFDFNFYLYEYVTARLQSKEEGKHFNQLLLILYKIYSEENR